MAVPDVTLNEAAELLGVHYMTAYRYVRLGVLPAHKQGGTWHVAAADLDLVRQRSTGGDTDSPGGADGDGRRRAPWSARLEARLMAGDARGAWTVIEGALGSGAAPDQVYLEMISPAMISIGDRWAAGELDVSVEHRATGIALRLVGRMGPRFVRPGRKRGAVVMGAPAGDPHSLPLAMFADLIRYGGWEVSDLGADVPPASFVHAMSTTPDLIAVGVSVMQNSSLPAAAAALAAMRAADPEATGVRKGVLLVVGGRAITDHAAGVALGADASATDAQSFAALLKGTSTD